MSHIDSNTFAKNEKLTELDLSKNVDLTLGESEFLKSDSIEVLSLSECNLGEIPENAFQSMTKLEELDLSLNKITVSTINTTLLNKIKQILSCFSGQIITRWIR